ncbi:MAG: 2-C-methyl-D-erythritol 2,4-cyclodiphosphate synthase [Congregibacter sp.]
MRIGHGYDVHAFASDASDASDTIVLGGVHIPHSHRLLAHSDGDIALHALCDALLGAIAAGDIGTQFPDTDSANKDVDSRILLRRCAAMVLDAGFVLSNADVTIVAQAPRMADYVGEMRVNIAQDMGVDATQVSVKATTTERLGFVGRKEGIAVHAVVLLVAR